MMNERISMETRNVQLGMVSDLKSEKSTAQFSQDVFDANIYLSLEIDR